MVDLKYDIDQNNINKSKMIPKHIVLGSRHSCIVATSSTATTGTDSSGDHSRTVMCWGANNEGQLGDDTHKDHHVPTAIDPMNQCNHSVNGHFC